MCKGSPVIVEANCPEYRWCTRFTIYTGLPGVVGWNWHQRQQRVFTSTWVEARVADVGNFYNTVDLSMTDARFSKNMMCVTLSWVSWSARHTHLKELPSSSSLMVDTGSGLS